MSLHTTHILQPLNVGVFKSFKAIFQNLTAHPGRVVTSDKVASLVAETWLLSLSPLNIMSGFKKTGIYPINPSEVTDRQIAPSKLFQQSQMESSKDSSVSDSPTSNSLFSPDQNELYIYTVLLRDNVANEPLSLLVSHSDSQTTRESKHTELTPL